jgi:hypothetical protein
MSNNIEGKWNLDSLPSLGSFIHTVSHTGDRWIEIGWWRFQRPPMWLIVWMWKPVDPRESNRFEIYKEAFMLRNVVVNLGLLVSHQM